MDRFTLLVASLLLCGILILPSCKQDSQSDNLVQSEQKKIPKDDIRFDRLGPEETGVNFSNTLDINQLKITLDYINVYNGGGVAVGDINNDGLPDLYFTGNQVPNKLYLNKGNFQFEDITLNAGVSSPRAWSTGVTMADVNNDGWLDIYVCRSYHDRESTLRENQLFINNGNLTFSEKAAEYGINDNNYSIQASFFDYDKDGHLDLFVGNHPRYRNKEKDVHFEYYNNPVLEYSDRIYHNNGNGTFSDVTKQAGILNYGWTLGISTTDYNQDGWQDIYVAVDHTEPDKLYENNGDGTFTNVIDTKFKHITASSMGMDAADINNDGNIDMYVVDMLQTDNFRQKTQMGSMNPERFWNLTETGYHFQYMRNQLHLNTGNNSFVDIGQMAGVHQTDWSWAALFADLNNNGWKDLYIANGYYRDVLDKDVVYNQRKDMYAAQTQNKSVNEIAFAYAKNMKTTKSSNYCYINNKDLTFSDISGDSGLDHLGYSTGAAYADLDNDGQLDLVTNNIDDPAYIYKNVSNSSNNFLRVKFNHSNQMHALGSKVTIQSGDLIQYQELLPTRGYQSMVESIVHFGLGKLDNIESVSIEWPDGKKQILLNVAANQVLAVDYAEAISDGLDRKKTPSTLFVENASKAGIDFVHEENTFDDYDKQILLPHKLSQFGPFVAKGDVNGDQLEDIFVGGASGQAGAIYVQKQMGHSSAWPIQHLCKTKHMKTCKLPFLMQILMVMRIYISSVVVMQVKPIVLCIMTDSI